MKASVIKTESMEMEYFSFGSGKKRLIILPGLGINRIVKSAQAVENAYKIFADEYTVYVFDRRKNPTDGCTIEDFADDTAAAMESLGIENADIFGASMGGMIAQTLAIKRPELVRSMILGSTVARPNPTAKKTIGGWIENAEKGKLDALTDDFINMLYSERLAKQLAGAKELFFGDVTDSELDSFIKQAKAIDGFDMYKNLKKISCPVLVIGVENDAVVTAGASREIAEKLGCELYMYGNEYGHCVFDEAPDYKQRIFDWLSKTYK